jgi:hypothetical protein
LIRAILLFLPDQASYVTGASLLGDEGMAA